ncbi:MAG: Rossmann-like and DUF2520 domain-containing protein [Crocinitomicaceae bacterium]
MRVNIIGSGNVATHMATWLFEKGVKIDCVYSQSLINAEKLANRVDSEFTNEIMFLKSDVNLNIVSIKDSAIFEVAKKLSKETPVVHTSGGVTIEVFAGFANFGILYPLQTFSKDIALKINDIPFLIETNVANFERELVMFVESYLSSFVKIASSEERKIIHLSAIISNNFMTYLLEVSKEILGSHDISLNILKPLIDETIRKSFANGPKESLTGPAVRGDFELVDIYSEMIKDESFKEIFKEINDGISRANFKIL